MSKRKFSINYLLNEAGNKVEEKFDYSKYFKKLQDESEGSRKFCLTRHKTRYTIETLKDVPNPEKVLFGLFDHAIFEAIKESNEMGYQPNKIAFNISSINLDPDVNVAFSKITENSIYAIYNYFLHIEQSKGKEQSLFGAPFTLEVTLCDSDKLPKEQKTSGKGRRIQPIRHAIDPKKLIEVQNPNNNYCLFIALELTRMYVYDYKIKSTISQKNYSNLTKNRMRQTWMATELIEKAGIQLGLKEYDAETYCPLVERYWQRNYPDTFKIFIFNEYGDYRPVYQSKVTKYKHAIVLYHRGEHFDGVRTMYKFFNKSPYYCFSCLAPYNQPKQHEAKCKGRCINCTRMGPDFPCPELPNYFRECDRCQKEFKNNDCFRAHI